MSEASADVVVLGAGPAGLGAAHRLAAAGRTVVVLERAPRVGGLAASFEVAGLRVDHGSHRLHPATAPEMMVTLRRLLGDDLQRRRRHGRIRLAGRFVAFPPHPADLARRLPPRLSTRLAIDALAAPLRRGPADDTFAEVVRARLGRALGETFYFPYAEKIWGRPATELSGELARRRVGARSLRDVARKALRRGPDAGVFFYPEHGFGQIPEALADAAVAAGVDVRLGAEVVGVDLDGRAAASVLLADGSCITGGQVWSTLPLPAFARLAGAPRAVLDAAERLSFRSLALVYLVVERPRWTEFDAHYFPERGAPMSRVSEPKNYRDAPADPRDVTVLCAEVPCSVGDEVWSAPPEQLGATVADALAREGLPAVKPSAVEVRRVAHAYPVYDLAYAAHFQVLDAWATAQPALLTFGRQGLFAHDNTHHALAMAWAAADALGAAERVDSGDWSAARERFAAHVVED